LLLTIHVVRQVSALVTSL